MSLFVFLLIFIGLSVGLAWFLIAKDRGEKEPVLALWQAAGLGFLGAVAAAILEARFVSENNLRPGAAHGQLLQATMLVALIEELCKFLPLALIIYRRRYFNELTDGVIYFALAGLGFGLPENILYTLKFGGRAAVARLVLTPLFHAAITGMVGYFLVRRKLEGKSPVGVVVPLLAAVVLHGFYDFGLLSDTPNYILASLVITLSISGGLFLVYSLATVEDQRQGRSAVGHNNFCRSCGTPNPKHNLYCTRCGQRA